MDIFAHMLWTNAGAKGLNTVLVKKYQNQKPIKLWEATFWGVFPDFFAFGVPFVTVLVQVLSGDKPISMFASRDGAAGFDIAATLYQYSHSIVIWAVVFAVVWILIKRPHFALFGWLLHILIDIPSHAATFYATPFLFPLSDYKFLYGISWANPWYMIINYSALVILYIWLFRKKLRLVK